MGKHIFEEGPRKGHAAGDTSIEQMHHNLLPILSIKQGKK